MTDNNPPKNTSVDGSTLDLVGFDGVRPDGVVETRTTFAKVVELTPREWLTISDAKRENLFTAISTWLRGIEFPVQFLTVSRPFPDQYSRRVGAVEAPEPSSSRVADDGSDEVWDQQDVLAFGRVAHARWVSDIISRADIRDRSYYIAVGVQKNGDGGSGLLDRLLDGLPVSRGPGTVDDETPLLDELDARSQRVSSQLPRTGVETTVIDDREAVLSLLYYLNRGVEPDGVPEWSGLVGVDRQAVDGGE